MISKEIAENSLFIQEWVKDNLESYMLMYPQTRRKDIKRILTEVAEKYAENKDALLHNDYQDDQLVKLDLLTLYDWYKTKKPIAAGNGTFFFDHNKVYSPIQNVIEGRIADRKKYQKIRDQYEKSSYEYMYFEMMQMEAKIKINSIYGSFGATTFQLYNKYTASATTGTAQSLISATAIGFEAFLSNNVPYRSIDECVIFLKDVLRTDEYVDNDFQIVKMISDKMIVFNRIKQTFREWKNEYSTVIMKILDNCNDIELTKLYYKNNIYGFMDNEFIKSLLIGIFNKTTEFRNPNVTPEEITDDLELLWHYTNEFVFYNHAYTERINRLKNDKRKSVVLVDTDSDIINIQPWVDYIQNNIWDNSSTLMDKDDKIFTSVNILAYLVTKMVTTLLNKYCTDCNVLERFHSRINMKNEFYFTKLLLANVKKRYVALIRLREGKELNPPKVELKGHDFRKSAVNEDIREALEGIISTCILNTDQVNTSLINSKLDVLEQDIRDSLKNGERKYLVRMNCKNANAYDNPMSQGAVKSVLLWNTIFPNNEILVPAKLDIVLISVPNEKALEVIKNSYPVQYDRMLKYMQYEKSIRSSNSEGDGSKGYKGLSYLALPNNGEPVPDFIKPFIDVNKVISRNIGTFKPITQALGFNTLTTPNADFFSNILDI
jgi:hypothetical protein